MTVVARQLSQPGLWFDTSETLSLSQYQYCKQNLGMQGAIRYVPLYGASNGITKTELDAAFAAGLSMMFVQFARSSGWSAATGAEDGQAGALWMLNLGIPAGVCLWLDLDVTPTAQIVIDYVNAWYAAAAKYLGSASPGVYMEPGVPLNASDRYSKLNLHRYWATAANDPNRFPSNRGCQIIQAWGSTKGEYFPEPGLVIDGDLVQSDYFGSFPVVASQQ